MRCRTHPLAASSICTHPSSLLVFNYYQGNYNKTRGTIGENVSALRANDPADEALYAAAKLRFWSDVQRYAVTPESCRARGCSFNK